MAEHNRTEPAYNQALALNMRFVFNAAVAFLKAGAIAFREKLAFCIEGAMVLIEAPAAFSEKTILLAGGIAVFRLEPRLFNEVVIALKGATILSGEGNEDTIDLRDEAIDASHFLSLAVSGWSASVRSFCSRRESYNLRASSGLHPINLA